MSEDVYFRLGERLNQNQVKMLLIEPYMKILREFYTPEQAELGADFPLGAFTAAELTKTYNQDKESLTEMLETMAVNELTTRLERLTEFQIKARFAMADSYDRATRAQAEEKASR